MLLRVEFVPILARFCHRKTDHPFFLATRERQKMLANAFSLIHSYCQILHGLAATAHYLVMKNISKMILYIRQWNSGSTKNEGYLCLLHAGVNDTATTTNFECGLPHSHLKRQIQNKELRMYKKQMGRGKGSTEGYRPGHKERVHAGIELKALRVRTHTLLSIEARYDSRYVSALIHIHTTTHIHTYTHTHIHTYTHTRIHTHIHTYAHTYTAYTVLATMHVLTCIMMLGR